jgi:anti-anti-sigma regulatory factor
MTGKIKKPLMDHDPLEWVSDEENDSRVVEEAVKVAVENEPMTEKGVTQITLQENEKMDRVAELHELLLQALDNGGAIEVYASAVRLIDAAALQLLVLSFQKAVKQGQAVTIVEPSQSFRDAAGLLGLAALFGI